jgi:hypothetical protein
MKIADRKQADDVIALVRAIQPAGRAGIELQSLAARVPIPPKRVERLLRRHSDYFVQIADQPQYTLNRFGEFRGDADLIIADIEQSQRRFSRLQFAGSVLLLITILLMFGGNLFFN